MKGILLSLGILIPTILPSQIRLVPFPGIFSTYIGAHLSKRQFRLRPLSRGLFSIVIGNSLTVSRTNFRPLSRGLFFNWYPAIHLSGTRCVFVPFLGDLFSIIMYARYSQKFLEVFVPFLGDLFSILINEIKLRSMRLVFVPFLGDFFSIGKRSHGD